MEGWFAIGTLVVSFFLLAGVIAVLVVLRRGEGPTFGVNREYDTRRREAVQLLTGEEVEFVPGTQWFRKRRRRPLADDSLAEPFRSVVADALRVVVPDDRGLVFENDGTARLESEAVTVISAVSTAELRQLDLGRWEGRARMLIGLVLFNPEPPGGDTTRVTLPVQVLFEPLKAADRADLVREFGYLAEQEKR